MLAAIEIKAVLLSNLLLLCISSTHLLAPDHATSHPPQALSLAAFAIALNLLNQHDLLCLLERFMTADIAVLLAFILQHQVARLVTFLQDSLRPHDLPHFAFPASDSPLLAGSISANTQAEPVPPEPEARSQDSQAMEEEQKGAEAKPEHEPDAAIEDREHSPRSEDRDEDQGTSPAPVRTRKRTQPETETLNPQSSKRQHEDP